MKNWFCRYPFWQRLYYKDTALRSSQKNFHGTGFFNLHICGPASEFLSAGSIPTSINYIFFPASFLLFSLEFSLFSNQLVKITSFVGFVFTSHVQKGTISNLCLFYGLF